MNKEKGYTIIEILLVLAIIIIVSSISVVSFITIRNKQKEKDYSNMVENVKTASELYLRNDNNFKSQLETGRIINLPIIKLVDNGYLDDYYTTNPINNKSIKESCIIITLGTEDEYEFGELRNCDPFLGMFPNPLIIYKGSSYNLLEGVVAYDKDGNKVTNPVITIESNADAKINDNNNINKEIEISYQYEGQTYIRKIRILLLEVEIDKDTDYEIPASGKYQIIAYGAQGSENGGKGGQIVAETRFDEGNILNIKIGTTINGGIGQFSGGGATTIKLNNELLIGAAGGGGGATGTYGGNDSGTGGICETNYDTNTCINGTDGDKFETLNSISGGGSSGNFKSCTKLKQIWNPCVSGSNTCEAGYDNINCSSCYYGSPSTCSYGCDRTYSSCATGSNTCVGGYVNGSCKSYQCKFMCGGSQGGEIGSWGSCTNPDPRSCALYDRRCSSYYQVWDSCKTGSNTCQCGYINSNCSSCYYGSPSTCSYGCDSVYNPCKTGSNTCIGDNVDTSECEILGEIKYNSGNGGKNYIKSTIQIIENNQGIKENNGLVKIKYIGE